jgi:hypothetical protein
MELSETLKQKGVTLNEHGQICFEVTTLGLTGPEWLQRLTTGGHTVAALAKNILSKYDYNQNHRYKTGKTLKVFLVFGEETKEDYDRTAKNMKDLASKQAGDQAVSDLKGELTFLLREKFTNEELEQLGVRYIVVPHTQIVDCEGYQNILLLYHLNDKSGGVDAGYDRPRDGWSVKDAFAFLVST